MSFILDALRKSEHERQRHAGPSLAAAPGASRASRAPWIFLGLGFLLALNLIGLVAFWIWRDARQSAPITPPREPTESRAIATTPAARSAARSGATQRLIRPLTDEAIDAGPELPPAAAPATPAAELLPEMPGDRTATTAVAAPARAAEVTTDPEGVPAMAELDASVTAGLPVLNLDLHVYVPQASRRFVFVNGTRYAEGETLKEGPVVERITREGAVLRHRGVRFLLQGP
jgi:general secretion pathway protein B